MPLYTIIVEYKISNAGSLCDNMIQFAYQGGGACY